MYISDERENKVSNVSTETVTINLASLRTAHEEARKKAPAALKASREAWQSGTKAFADELDARLEAEQNLSTETVAMLHVFLRDENRFPLAVDVTFIARCRTRLREHLMK